MENLILDIDPKNYKVEKGAENDVHVYLENQRHDVKSGRKVSRGAVVTYNRTDWRKAKEHIQSLGFSLIVIFHAPKDMPADELTVKGADPAVYMSVINPPTDGKAKGKK